MPDVLLILPPFFTGGKPSSVLSCLKAILNDNEIDAEVFYANLIFKRRIGSDFFEDLSFLFNYYNISEFIFSTHAFPALHKKHKNYENLLKAGDINLYEKIGTVRDSIDDYFDDVKEYIAKKKPEIVWLYLYVKQLTSSIAIANLIKKNFPNTVIVAGGYSCFLPIGEELVKIAPAIDYLFSGEPEEQFLSFCKLLLNDKKNFDECFPDKIIHCSPIKNINNLPYPDFSDYYDQKTKLWFFSNTMSFEGSRGCWHGEKSHCLFCIHNDENIIYRKKTPQRALAEINYLVKKYNPEYIYASDSIMPLDYPEKVFKNFEKPEKLKNIFFEVSPKLSFKQLTILKEKGMNNCQPGIESFNNDILKLLNKGTNVCENIRFLRDCKTLKIHPYWNFLYGIPGEEEHQYTEMLKFLPHIIHLNPPFSFRTLIITRFSPLFKNAESYNIHNLRPVESYKYIFPNSADIYKLSLFFEGEFKKSFDNKALEKSFFDLIELWINKWKNTNEAPCLYIFKKNNELYIHDSRYTDNKKNLDYESHNISKRHLKIIDYLFLPKKEEVVRDYILNNRLEEEFHELQQFHALIKIDTDYISLVNYKGSHENYLYVLPLCAETR